MALCVHPEFWYVRAKDPAAGKTYIVAESRLKEIPGAVPKPKKAKKGQETTQAEGGWQVIVALSQVSERCLELKRGWLTYLPVGKLLES